MSLEMTLVVRALQAELIAAPLRSSNFFSAVQRLSEDVSATVDLAGVTTPPSSSSDARLALYLPKAARAATLALNVN